MLTLKRSNSRVAVSRLKMLRRDSSTPRRTHVQRRIFLGCLLILLWGARGETQEVGTIERLSVNANGVEGNAESGPGVTGPNSNFVAFVSNASNLVPNDGNGAADIFVKNRSTGQVFRANLNSNNQAGNQDSFTPAVSPSAPNGFGVLVFSSLADNLWFPGTSLPDNNNVRDIFYSLPKSGKVERVTIGVGPAAADGPSFDPSVTIVPEPNRMLVSYSSRATNLVEDDTNGVQDVFLTTIANSEGVGAPTFFEDYQTVLVSRPNNPSLVSDGESGNSQVSGDGRYVVYESEATNLVDGVTPTGKQIYLYSVSDGTTTLVSRAADGSPGNAPSRNPSISFAGGYVVFLTRATNILDDGFEPSGDALQIVRYNTRTQALDRVNAALDGTPGNGISGLLMNSQITSDGRLVAFSDTSSNLVEGDQNGASDIFVKDMDTGVVTRLSRGLGDVDPDGGSRFPFLSLESFSSQTVSVLFASAASNLVENDTSSRIDVFQTSYTASVPQLRRNTRIEVPPDVVVSEDDITITTEAFSLNAATASATSSGKDLVGAAKRKKKRIRYLIEASREGETGKAADRRRKIAKRNSITLRNLKEGTYLVRYRVLTYRDGNIIRRTPYSPAQRVSRSSSEA